MGWDFQAAARSHCIRAPRREMRIMAPRPGIEGHAQGVSLQDPGMFQTDLGSLAVARLHRFRCPQENQAPCGP